MINHKSKILVIGGGFSGLTAALHLVEKGFEVSLFTNTSLKSSGSIYRDEKINAVFVGQSGSDSPEQHFNDTCLSAENITSKQLALQMCQMAPDMVHLLCRMGVYFERTVEQNFQFTQLQGSSFARSLSSRFGISRQILNVLKQQILYLTAKNRIKLYEGWEFLSLILDEKKFCHGIVAQHKKNMKMGVFKSDAVVLATGDMSSLYGKYSLKGPFNTGSAMARVYAQGASLSNCEFISFYPYSVLGQEKSLKIPADLIKSDKQILKSETHQSSPAQTCVDLKDVLQDQTHQDVSSLIELYAQINPHQKPVPVQDAVETTWGGLWTDERLMTGLKGVFAVGDCTHQFHGAKALLGNLLPAQWASGVIVAESCQNFLVVTKGHRKNLSDDVFTECLKTEYEKTVDYLDMSGPENIHGLYSELSQALYKNLGPLREESQLQKLKEILSDLKERQQRIAVTDKSKFQNEEIFFIRSFENMLTLAEVSTECALLRKESRGCHQRIDFPVPDQKNFEKISVATQVDNKPCVSFITTETSLNHHPNSVTLITKAAG